MNILLLNDPMGNLDPVRDTLLESEMEADMAWESVEAERLLATGKYDALIVSGLGLAGDAISTCIACKGQPNNHMMAVVYAPYPIKD